METIKKAVVEPPKHTAPPVKAQPHAEPKPQHEGMKPGENQPKPRT
ncbi:MAG TPA: hypothetical protein VNE16_13810 [Vicinamibacterales bacterium]|nr:hypothetical protein [Vicinamibacterales bacterium]